MGKDITIQLIPVKQYNDLLATKIQVEIKCKKLERLVRKLQKNNQIDVL